LVLAVQNKKKDWFLKPDWPLFFTKDLSLAGPAGSRATERVALESETGSLEPAV